MLDGVLDRGKGGPQTWTSAFQEEKERLEEEEMKTEGE